MPRAVRFVGLALLLLGTRAFRWYLTLIPNADKVPCISDSAGVSTEAAGCRGAAICEAFGHVDCWPRRGDLESTLPKQNAFGEVIRKRQATNRAGSDGPGAGIGWTVGACAEDTDSDGFTNGDELGDGCCAWNSGSPVPPAPFRGADISHPNAAVSVPGRASCTLAGPPGAVIGLQRVVFRGSAVPLPGIAISWAAPLVSASCVCEYRVSVAVGGVVTTYAVPAAPLGANRTGFAACVVPPGAPSEATATISVVARNRAGLGPASAPLVFSVPPSGTLMDFSGGSGPPLACSVPAASPAYTDTAGTIRPLPLPLATGGAVIAAVLVAVLLAAGVVCGVVADPHSRLRACFLHRPVPFLCGPRGALSPLLARLAAQQLYTPSHASAGYLLALILVLAAVGGAWASANAWYSRQMFPVGTGGAPFRAAGYALAVALGLQILPMQRFSLWAHAIGVPYDRAVRMHRWLGPCIVVAAAVHAFGMLATYATGALPAGAAQLGVWSDRDANNALAGVLAGCGIVVMAAPAVPWVRRRAYWVFKAAHWLWPAVLGLAAWHVKDSDTPAWPLFVPGLALIGCDAVAAWLDVWMRPAELRDVRLVHAAAAASAAGDDAGPPVAVELHLRKYGLGSWWPFVTGPGSFVYLTVPALGLAAHPFSVSSPPLVLLPPSESDRRGRAPFGPAWTDFTIHVRDMGLGTWTHALVSLLMAREGGTVLPSRGARAESQGVPEGETDDFNVASDRDAMQQQPPRSLRYPDGVARSSSWPWVLVSGPVGRVSLQLERYEHIVLVAGGIGITPLVPVFVAAAAGPAGRAALLPAGGPIGRALQSLQRAVCGRCRPGMPPPPPPPLRTLSLLWSVRERGLAECFEKHLSAAAGAASDAATITSVDVFESRPPPRLLADGELRAAAVAVPCPVPVGPRGGKRSSSTSRSPVPVEPAAAATAAGSAPGVRFHDGRPDVAAFLRSAALRAAEASSGSGNSPHATGSSALLRPRIAVLVCGPLAMVDAVCGAAAASGGPAEFHVHTEAFLL